MELWSISTTISLPLIYRGFAALSNIFIDSAFSTSKGSALGCRKCTINENIYGDVNNDKSFRPAFYK